MARDTIVAPLREPASCVGLRLGSQKRLFRLSFKCNLIDYILRAFIFSLRSLRIYKRRYMYTMQSLDL